MFSILILHQNQVFKKFINEFYSGLIPIMSPAGKNFWQLMCPGLDIVPHPITSTFLGGQCSMYLEMMKRK